MVDYTTVSNSITLSIKYFKILDFTTLSDHRPTSCCLKTTQMPIRQNVDIDFSLQPPWYIWNPGSSPDEFQSFQSEANNIQSCNSVYSRLCNSEDVKGINSDLINILTNIARSSLELKRSLLNNNGGRKSRKNAWFDPKWIRSRISLRKACKNYCKSPTNETIIKLSYQMREEHKKLI